MKWLEQRAGGPWKLAGWLVVASILSGLAGLAEWVVDAPAALLGKLVSYVALAVFTVVVWLFILQIELIALRKLEQWTDGPWKLAGLLLVALILVGMTRPPQWMGVWGVLSSLATLQLARAAVRKRPAQPPRHLGVRQWLHFARRQVQGRRASALKLAAVVLLYVVAYDVAQVLALWPAVMSVLAIIAITLALWRIFPVNDNITGQGRLTYTGERNSDGKPHGQGTMTLADGTTYSGEVKDGERHGQGTYTFVDSTTYTGEFEDGFPVSMKLAAVVLLLVVLYAAALELVPWLWAAVLAVLNHNKL